MTAFAKALLLGVAGLAVCLAFPSVTTALWVTVLSALVASWRALRRWL